MVKHDPCHFPCRRRKITLRPHWAAILLIAATLPLAVTGCQEPAAPSVPELAAEYIRAWQEFYPSAALAEGDASAAPRFEDFAADRVAAWVAVNQELRQALDRLGPPASLNDRIDARMLHRQARSEEERWVNDQALRHSPGLYGMSIGNAFTHLLVRDNLTPAQKAPAVLARLTGIRRLCGQARVNLSDGRPADTAAAIRGLDAAAAFLEGEFAAAAAGWFEAAQRPQLHQSVSETVASVRELAGHLRHHLQPRLTLADAYGREIYGRKLPLILDMDIDPDELAAVAEEEIQTVRREMAALAETWWQTTYPAEPMPADFDTRLQRALTDMETNRASNQQDFLQLFRDLIQRAEDFTRDRQLATLPAERTLYTALSPAHFAGAAVGGVYSSGPFDPEADTLFYLPTIPDDAPAEAREGFYRSFNNHFNTMIITHEICPGHYLQLKLAARGDHPVRSLFCPAVFSEGWATFCEEMTLGAGWDDDHPLTRLAHLRKRLENAVRAYTSVQVHCHDWDRDRVTRFAVEEGLLPPQFSTNLWSRILHSPLQLPSYFLGYRRIREICRSEQERLGPQFSLRRFNDTILQSGGLPLDLLPDLLAMDNTGQ
ncbi:MAG: DUF885 domain-containing protein [Acidobacteria bacterium]|nr:DUF885 domain-containing protein [Acidobacteriota bacterium]